MRDAALQVAGHDLLRYTQRRILGEEEAVFGQLRALLLRRGWSGP